MLSREDNELMCRVGADTPMGKAMRRYWIPALLSEELPEAGGDPRRVQLLGEEFVAFRGSDGTVGFVREACRHRGASLALGRVEGCAIRCLYHGWKFATDGTVLETPNVSDERFKGRFKQPAFPTREAGGLIWVYLGPREKEPAFPHWHWFDLPSTHILPVTYVVDCNYVQVIEGLFDSSHLTVLHQDGFLQQVGDGFNQDYFKKSSSVLSDAAPKSDAEETEFGFHYVALRQKQIDGAAKMEARIATFIAPFMTLNPNGDFVGIVVPMSDVRSRHFFVFWDAENKVGEEPQRSQQLKFVGMDEATMDAFGISLKTCDQPGKPSRENNFLQDRAAMRNGRFTGLPLFIPEDVAMTVSCGEIRDRSTEMLANADIGIATLYRALLTCARRIERDETPIELKDTNGIVGINGLLDDGQAWQELVPHHKPLRRRTGAPASA